MDFGIISTWKINASDEIIFIPSSFVLDDKFLFPYLSSFPFFSHTLQFVFSLCIIPFLSSRLNAARQLWMCFVEASRTRFSTHRAHRASAREK